MKRHRIAVDARMVHNSGIGTVLRNLLQRWLLLAGDTQFYLLGNPELLGAYGWAGRENVSLVDCRVPIYSVQEQLVVPRCVPADAELLWVPHYNIPVLYGGRLLVTVHDVFHLDRPEFVPGLHRRLYAKMMFRAVAERASHVVCVSEFTRKRFLHFEPGFPENETSVIPNGVDDFWQQPGRENGRIYQRPYLLFVGNVKPNKNLGRLLSAFDMVRHELPHDLVIVGRREGFITADGETLRQAEACQLVSSDLIAESVSACNVCAGPFCDESRACFSKPVHAADDLRVCVWIYMLFASVPAAVCELVAVAPVTESRTLLDIKSARMSCFFEAVSDCACNSFCPA